jgi:hypothetical protein
MIIGKFITFNSYKQRNLGVALNNTRNLILLGRFPGLPEKTLISGGFSKNIADSKGV